MPAIRTYSLYIWLRWIKIIFFIGNGKNNITQFLIRKHSASIDWKAKKRIFFFKSSLQNKNKVPNVGDRVGKTLLHMISKVGESM